jgi:hypothetical protein
MFRARFGPTIQAHHLRIHTLCLKEEFGRSGARQVHIRDENIKRFQSERSQSVVRSAHGHHVPTVVLLRKAFPKTLQRVCGSVDENDSLAPSDDVGHLILLRLSPQNVGVLANPELLIRHEKHRYFGRQIGE